MQTLPDPLLAWPIPYQAVALIAQREGCRLAAYRCPAGRWTCGWGQTAGVLPTTRWTQLQADQDLCAALTDLVGRVLALCTEHPSPNQLGAMVSLAYNIGIGAFAKSSVLRAHNRADFQAAARAFALWNKATIGGRLQVLPGLTARRAAEAALYLAPEPDAPPEPMPQAVESESTLAASPIAQSGGITAATGLAAVLAQVREQLGPVGEGITWLKTELLQPLGLLDAWVMPALLVGLGLYVVWQRRQQRVQGWA